MRLPDDDELYEVDQTYLGPPGRYIAAMRHKAIFAWFVTAPISFVFARRIGVPFTVLTVGLLLLFTIWAAQTIADKTSAEVSVAALAVGFWHDLNTPRPAPVRSAQAGPAFARVTRPRGVWERLHRRRARRAADELVQDNTDNQAGAER